ncbi:hypothetical protein FQN53_002756 [Emmonsiellopsis sp. PD_33]|nr:hypothetical protein FQN53_002756 [Emmonsiellopsis sp. PD_33]KAK2797808.1 hypothetical protein FQN51_008264 [Onygenales sp. PD_10]
MSNQYFQDGRRRPAGPTGFSSTGRRTALGYWLPLIFTVGVATVSLAAWVWSERQDDDDDDDDDGRPQRRRHDGAPINLDSGGQYPQPEGDYARTTGAYDGQHEDASVISRVQGALRRTPSPQQLFDGASRKVAAGVAAAGAAVGGALTAIREEGAGDFEDHSRWTEEANSRGIVPPSHTAEPPAMSGALASNLPPPAQLAAGKHRKTVAIVVSSVSEVDDTDGTEGPLSEHASILSHLPEYVDPDTARVFVLIYAPGMQPRSANSDRASRPALSLSSSYANIGHEEAGAENSQNAGLETIEPRPAADSFESSSPLFKTLYNQAQTLVDKETMIMPFSTPTGHVHMLRHISPDIVYMQESLSGNDGESVHHISKWVRQVVIVVGDEGGRGGLVDSDDESALADKGEKWWQKEGVTGLGKRIDVVDGLRTGEDWGRRVSGHD